MTRSSAGARAHTRDAGDHHQASARVARDRMRRDRPEWLTPARAQIECELRGILAMLSDQDGDKLVTLAIGLWRESSVRCVGDRTGRSDA